MVTGSTAGEVRLTDSAKATSGQEGGRHVLQCVASGFGPTSCTHASTTCMVERSRMPSAIRIMPAAAA
jgi:hypothetical protein